MKPCFCCGRKPIRIAIRDRISYQCPRCGTGVEYSLSDEDARNEWNKINLCCTACPEGVYIGEGDFVCDRHIADPERALVIDGWQPTDNYLQCQR